MDYQTVLITGCSSGIGLSTAILLAKQTEHEFKIILNINFRNKPPFLPMILAWASYQVFATMRNMDKKTALETAAADTLNKSLFIRELDVTKETTITVVVEEILRDYGRIDVLVNNAGVSAFDYIDGRSIEYCQTIMDTNYWGVVRATRAVLPAMKKQKSGRIVNVSSIVALIGSPFLSTYTSSKAAMEAFSESIATVLRKGYNIRVSIVEPRGVRTNIISRDDMLISDDMNVDDTMRGFYQSFLEKGKSVGATSQTAEELAKLHLDIILSGEPKLRYQSTDHIAKLAATRLVNPTTESAVDLFS